MSAVKNTRKRKLPEGSLSKANKSRKKKKQVHEKDEELAPDKRENAEHAQLLDSVTGQIKKLLPFEEEEEKTTEGTKEHDSSVGASEELEREDTKGIDKLAAAEYLVLWETDRRKWSFKKKTQYWLLQNMYDKKKVSKSSFKLMLDYLDGLRGNQRAVARERAVEVMSQNETGKGETAESKLKFKRAVKVLRVLDTTKAVTEDKT